VRNTQRTVGTRLGSEVTRRFGSEGLPEDTISINFKGSAGQSFMAFVPKGITFVLEGDANDYLGKGLSGGKLILRPPLDAGFAPGQNVIAGNVALYGATSGEAYIRGMTGERFCVRNSGASAVGRGRRRPRLRVHDGWPGDRPGSTGRNFAAGMSGGVAMFWTSSANWNPTAIWKWSGWAARRSPGDRAGVEPHKAARRIHREPARAGSVGPLAQWKPLVVRVIPDDYRRVMAAQKLMREKGLSPEEAEMAAFQLNAKDGAQVAREVRDGTTNRFS